MNTLCVQLLQFYDDCFETLQMFRSWSEDVHMFWTLSSDYFATSFLKMSLVSFSAFIIIKVTISDTGYLVCATHFMLTLLKHYRCFWHGLKMCMYFFI